MYYLYLGSFILSSKCDSAVLYTDKIYLYSLADWGPNVDVVGFCFLDLASNYQPPDSLVEWLAAGTKPIYIGFGSLVSFFSLFVPFLFFLFYFLFIFDVGGGGLGFVVIL